MYGPASPLALLNYFGCFGRGVGVPALWPSFGSPKPFGSSQLLAGLCGRFHSRCDNLLLHFLSSCDFVPSSCLASAIAAAKKPEARTLRTAATATIYWPMASLHAPKSFAAHALTHMAGTSVRLPIPAPGHAHTAVASALGAASSPWRRLELGRLQRRRRTPSTPLATWHTCRASPLQTRPIMSSLTSRRALP